MTTGPSVFGTTWRQRMPAGETPRARAASTYSWRLIDSVWPRTIRAISSQSTAPTADEHEDEVPPEEDDEHDDQEDERQRIEHVDDAHHDLVGAAADEAGGGAVEDPDRNRDEAGQHADGERDPPGGQRPGEEVAPDAVGAEEEIVARDRRRQGHAQPVRRAARDARVLERARPVEIARDAFVDRLGGADLDRHAAVAFRPRHEIDMGAPERFGERRLRGRRRGDRRRGSAAPAHSRHRRSKAGAR